MWRTLVRMEGFCSCAVVCKGTRRKRSTRRKRWYANHDEPSLICLDEPSDGSWFFQWKQCSYQKLTCASKICTPALVNPQHSWGLWMFFPKKKMYFNVFHGFWSPTMAKTSLSPALATNWPREEGFASPLHRISIHLLLVDKVHSWCLMGLNGF